MNSQFLTAFRSELEKNSVDAERAELVLEVQHDAMFSITAVHYRTLQRVFVHHLLCRQCLTRWACYSHHVRSNQSCSCCKYGYSLLTLCTCPSQSFLTETVFAKQVSPQQIPTHLWFIFFEQAWPDAPAVTEADTLRCVHRMRPYVSHGMGALC